MIVSSHQLRAEPAIDFEQVERDRLDSGYEDRPAREADSADTWTCECGWPATDCADGSEYLPDCPRFRAAVERASEAVSADTPEAVYADRERFRKALNYIMGFTKAGPTRNEYDAVIYAVAAEALVGGASEDVSK